MAADPLVRLHLLRESDLAWFDYRKYTIARLNALGLAGWIQVLSDRLAIKGMVAWGQQDLALEAMAELQKDPLTSLGFNPPSIVGDQPGDTPTVFFIRAGMVASYCGLTLKHKLAAGDVFDLALRQAVPGAPMHWATVQVDLRAKRTQIMADFKSWLNQVDLLLSPPAERKLARSSPKKRKTAQALPKQIDYLGPSAFDDWIESEYLPFFDLALYADLRQRAIPDDLMQRLVRRTSETESPANMLKAPRRSLEVFTADTVHTMWRQREARQPSSAGASVAPVAVVAAASKAPKRAPKRS